MTDPGPRRRSPRAGASHAALVLVPALLTVPLGAGAAGQDAEPDRESCGPADAPFVAPKRFVAPVQAGQGALFADGPGEAWTASLRAHPSVGVGRCPRLWVGASAAAHYLSPELEGLLGARVAYRLTEGRGPLSLAVDLAAEALPLGTEDRETYAVAAEATLDEVLMLGLRVGRETRDDDTFFELGAGVEVVHLVEALSGGARDGRGEDGGPGTEPLTLFRSLEVRMATEASFLCEPERAALLRRSRAVVDEAAGSEALDELVTLLRSEGLGEVAERAERAVRRVRSRAEAPPDPADPEAQRRTVEALVDGWRTGMQC